jgi:hypothetical protein
MTNLSNQASGQPRVNKTKGLIIAPLIVGALALPFLISAPHAQAEHRERSRDPLGAWFIQVDLDPNSVPSGTPLNFMAVCTFSADGAYMQSNTGPGAGGPPGQGNWVRTEDGKFAGTELRFGFDAAHHFTGINKIRESFTLNEQGDVLTGNVQVDIFLPDGTLLPVHPTGTYHGTRIAIEPLK